MSAFTDTCTIIGALISIITLPPAIWAIREHTKWGSFAQDSVKSIMSNNFYPNEDRVLLQFDPSRTSQAGTFENDILNFKNSVSGTIMPFPYKEFLLIDPGGVITACEKQIKIVLLCIIGVAIVFLVALSIGSIFWQPAENQKPSSWWEIIGGIFVMIFAVTILMFMLKELLYEPYKTRNIAIAYVNYLAQNGIRIGFEFTKLRSSLAATNSFTLPPA